MSPHLPVSKGVVKCLSVWRWTIHYCLYYACSTEEEFTQDFRIVINISPSIEIQAHDMFQYHLFLKIRLNQNESRIRYWYNIEVWKLLLFIFKLCHIEITRLQNFCRRIIVIWQSLYCCILNYSWPIVHYQYTGHR